MGSGYGCQGGEGAELAEVDHAKELQDDEDLVCLADQGKGGDDVGEVGDGGILDALDYGGEVRGDGYVFDLDSCLVKWL